MAGSRSPVVFCVFVGLFVGACSSSVVVEPVARRDITETAVVSGRVEAAGRVMIGALVPGVVAEVAVVAGQDVKIGDLLLRFDDSAEVAALAQARAAQAQARAHLVEVRQVTHALAVEELKQAELAADLAARVRDRTRRLVAAGGATAIDDENAAANADLLVSRKDAAAVRARAAAEGGASVLVAQAQLQSANAGVRVAEAALDKRRISALVAARVLSREVEPGDAVSPGRPLLVLGRDGTAKIKVQPDEKTLRVLQIGQEARVSADAFAGSSFAARVAEIAPVVDSNRGTVDVELTVTNAPAYLRTDMTVSVEIVVGNSRAAVVVPLDAVRDLATAAPYVLVQKGDIAEQRSVTLGARGDHDVAVTAGVAEGEFVVVGSPALKPGARIKAGS